MSIVLLTGAILPLMALISVLTGAILLHIIVTPDRMKSPLGYILQSVIFLYPLALFLYGLIWAIILL